MLEFEIAAIYYFVKNMLEIQHYFEEVPENMVVPCIFYPPAELDSEDFSLSSFSTSFTMYAKIMCTSNMEASYMANKVLEKVCENRKKIPLVDENGNYTGKNFRLDDIKVKKVTEGVWQIAMSWKRYSAYTGKTASLAREFFMNGALL